MNATITDMLEKVKRFPKRLLVWVHVMLTTSTDSGGKFLFFQRVYFLFNTATVLERLHKPSGKKYRNYLQKKFDREIVIKNPIGKFSANPKNDSFTKSITSFEYNHQPWLAEAKNKKVFVDIGANIGFYSILAVTKYGFQHAYAFEPNPVTYARLRKNIELNGLNDKITVYTFGLSDHKANANLTAKNVHTGGSTFVQNSISPTDATTIEVPTDTFDNMAQEHDLNTSSIGFIKIDVEGFEYEVLQGMRHTMPKLLKDTYLFIEIHPSARFAKETKKLITESDFVLLKSSPQKNFLYRKDS